MRRLLSPIFWLDLLNSFLDGLFASQDGDYVYTQIHCPCGHDWVQTRPNHYGGAAGYPLRCPACDGAGKVFETGAKKVRC